jgi:uncharacterized membrane protein YqjE
MADRSSGGGLLGSLRGLAVTGLTLLQTRLALLAVEIQEEKTRAVSLAAYSVAAVILLGAGAVFLAVFVTVLLWDSNRLLALGVFAALFLGGGLVCLFAARGFARAPSGLFAASMAELAKDRLAAEAGEESGQP